MADKLRNFVHQYGSESSLQRLGIWEVDAADKTKPWVIYIHGGAWRDPCILYDTIGKTIDELSRPDRHPGILGRVAGFASLDYRLSPHPDFPQDPATTPAKEYRHAQHPDHLNDVRTAMAFLQTTYGFGSRYILIGHSAGASLAFQLMASPGDAVAPPKVVVGVAGVYDMTGINKRSGGAYAGFLTAAFGDPSTWHSVAPLTIKTNYAAVLQAAGSGKVVLARSPDDELVDEIELDAMAERLRQEGCALTVVKDLHGQHDSCWKEGKDLARLISEAVEVIQ